MEKTVTRHQGDTIMTERAAVLGRIREAAKRRSALARAAADDPERVKLEHDVAQQRRRLLSIEAARQRMTRPRTFLTR